jgi:hypothetical protein
VGAVFARAGDGGVREDGDELQRRLPPNALLRGETIVQSATCARSSRAIQHAKSNFGFCSIGCCLEFAAKFREFGFFRFRIAVAGDGRAALRAELFAASLIHFLKSP